MDRIIFKEEISLSEFSATANIPELKTADSIQQFCEKYGDDPEDIRHYDVYLVSAAGKKCVLKKTDERGIYNYTQYLAGKPFSVPKLIDTYEVKWEHWLLTEYVQGEDIRRASDELIDSCAESLAAIQNYYWESTSSEFRKDDRFEVYRKRILRRATYFEKNEVLKRAYALFMERQETCPKTLSHGDFALFNIIDCHGKPVIIDWDFGGCMPYSLDIARFVAHADENGGPFGMYMTERQKKRFIDGVYRQLISKPAWEQYLRDIKLAVLNEYLEFLEADEDEDGWYYQHALPLAEELLTM